MHPFNEIKKPIVFTALLFFSTLTFANTAGLPATIQQGDMAWMLISSALVLLMTFGLAFFYGGMVGSKNTVATMMQSFIAIPIITLIWIIIGYSLAFSPGTKFIGSLNWVFFHGVGATSNPNYAGTISHLLFAIYQCMFAVITPAVITGAFAERMKFKAYLLFIAIWSLTVYAPVAHWIWGAGGWLRTEGVLDFAGGLVVHQTAGFSALIAALVVGQRQRRVALEPHNIPFILLGTTLLWFGWFGFNAGSALGSSELAVVAFVNTHIAACAAALAWLFADWLRGKPSLTGACIGAVVGLVAITPAAGFVTPTSAIIMGLIAGTICNYAVVLCTKTKLDDTLDVFACHGIGAFVGSIATGFLADKVVNAAGANGGFALAFIQFKGSVAVAIYSMLMTYIILKVLDRAVGLRVSPDQELKGLDFAEHGEKAYD